MKTPMPVFWKILIILLVVLLGLWLILQVVLVPSVPLPSPTPSTFPPILAVVNNETNCYITSNSGQIIASAPISEFDFVEVVGKDDTGRWFYVKLDELTVACWVDSSSLKPESDTASLSVISSSIPPISTVDSSQIAPIETFAISTEIPVTSTETPITAAEANDLEVTYDVDVIECACYGKLGRAIVTLTIVNGIPPYNISGQVPVLEKTVTFDAVLGSSITLEISSSDGKTWKDTIVVPSQCVSGCDDSGDPNPPRPPAHPPPTDPPPTQPPPSTPTIPPWICQIAPWLCD